ncbi:MATE family efflux transporter [Metaclostridioides mangenotii]|uniref:MATE family efflux transporter n=1 Tax=Metaclostridioides mangenotii TaxID=1540 RepID=UPI002E8DDF74|nr:MATE family efflux transporter [Clostridioides mangenotii]
MDSNILSNENISLKKKFIRYLGPSVVSMWVFSLYTMVDGIFVSKGVGELALASVNISMPFINFIFAVSLLFSTGASTVIAVLLGKKI